MGSTVVGGHPMVQDTLQARLYRAWVLLQLRKGHSLPLAWLGVETAKRLGREDVFIPSTVSKWMRGVIPGDLDTLEALADVLGVDPGWLTFGSKSRAPAPDDPTQGLRPTDQL